MNRPSPGDGPPPSLARRLASLLYESLLLFAVAFAGTWVFFFASGAKDAIGGLRHLLQLYLTALFAAYFLWCWLRGGQTLAMKAWRIRLVAPGHDRVPPRRALLRLVFGGMFAGSFLASVTWGIVHRNPWFTLACLAVSAAGVGWALFDRERQFLHDRLAGTRLILLPRARSADARLKDLPPRQPG